LAATSIIEELLQLVIGDLFLSTCSYLTMKQNGSYSMTKNWMGWLHTVAETGVSVLMGVFSAASVIDQQKPSCSTCSFKLHP